MRIKVAYAVLFTALFSSHALAQWDWLPNPPPPPAPPPPFNQPDSLKSLPQQRQSRPATRKRGGPVADRSTQFDARQGTVEEQKPRKKMPTKKRKFVVKQQKSHKAATPGPVTSPSSSGKTPTKPRVTSSEEKKRSTRASTSDSAGTKLAVKSSSKGRGVKQAARGTESSSKTSTSPQQDNDLLIISSDAANNPAVVAYRNCIASYFARGMKRGVGGTWAELVTRATEGECRMQFDGMAQSLSKRFGNQRAEQVMQQLIETTLLPAAKAAARGKSDTGVSAIPPQ
jgi:hypothetical protein